MKNFSLYIALLSTLILTSCGTSASYTAGAAYQDGIYYQPDYNSLQAAQSAEQSKLAALTEETRAKKVYTEPVDTIVLDQTSKDITVPLEMDKKYVVLLEGETYEERFKKFDDESDYTFSINFEYGYGNHFYGYPYSYAYPYRSTWHLSWYHPWYGPSYHYGWYDPWYDPWYYPGYYPYYPYYGPAYAYGWYDPWYYPGYYPMYPPIYPGYYPGGSGVASKDVIYGRRDLHRDGNRPANVAHNRNQRDVQKKQTATTSAITGANQIRGRELNRTTSAAVRDQGTSKGNNTSAIPTRSGVRNNYRASSNQNANATAARSSSNRDNGRATYQYNNNASQSQSTSRNSSTYQSRSGYQGSSYSGGGRSTGSSSSGSNYRTGGRR